MLNYHEWSLCQKSMFVKQMMNRFNDKNHVDRFRLLNVMNLCALLVNRIEFGFKPSMATITTMAATTATAQRYWHCVCDATNRKSVEITKPMKFNFGVHNLIMWHCFAFRSQVLSISFALVFYVVFDVYISNAFGGSRNSVDTTPCSTLLPSTQHNTSRTTVRNIDIDKFW